MAKIKVSELFYSAQGEGEFLGVGSIFLRTFGCNFTCAGFGMKKGEFSTERLTIDPKKYTEYNSLPLVHTGCDSYASWDPRFKHLSPMLETDAIVEGIRDLLPDGRFSRDKHLIITGGEPLLGWQRAFPELLDKIRDAEMNLTHLTFETNGTQILSSSFYEYLVERNDIHITWSISAKVQSSGEKREEAILPNVISQYVSIPHSDGYFKFVVATDDDVADVNEIVSIYRSAGIDLPIYLMPVGGTDQHYFKNAKEVCLLAIANGYRYSPRIQVDLFKNAWAT